MPTEPFGHTIARQRDRDEQHNGDDVKTLSDSHVPFNSPMIVVIASKRPRRDVTVAPP